MKTTLLKVGLLSCVVIVLSGCASPPGKPLTVKRGGFLEEKDYVAFQQDADKRKPISLPKKWPNPSPVTSFSFESDFDFRSIDRITVPNLVFAPTPGTKSDWVSGEDVQLFQRLVSDQISALLVSEKLVKEAPRSGDTSDAIMTGAVTFYKDGAVASWGPIGAQSFMQSEFKIISNGRKVGAIQVNGVRPKTLLGVMAVPAMEEQIAKGAVSAFKTMKTGAREDHKEMFVLPDWFIK